MNVRVQKMLKEPSPENVDRALRQPPLRPPRLLLHHPHLVEGPLLPEALVEEAEARRLALGDAGAAAVLLPEELAAVLELGGDGVLEAAEVAGHRLLRQGGVRHCRAEPHHHVEGIHHHLHLLAVMVVPSINLHALLIS